MRGDEERAEGEKGGATTMEAITKAKSPGFLKKLKLFIKSFNVILTL